jgi:hypothetical protein
VVFVARLHAADLKIDGKASAKNPVNVRSNVCLKLFIERRGYSRLRVGFRLLRRDLALDRCDSFLGFLKLGSFVRVFLYPNPTLQFATNFLGFGNRPARVRQLGRQLGRQGQDRPAPRCAHRGLPSN